MHHIPVVWGLWISRVWDRNEKINILGFSWGSQKPQKGKYMTNIPPKGINVIGVILKCTNTLAAKLLSPNRTYPLCTITVRLKGKSPIKYKLFKVSFQKAKKSLIQSTKSRWPDGNGQLREPTGDPPKVFSVIISMAKAEYRDATGGDPG